MKMSDDSAFAHLARLLHDLRSAVATRLGYLGSLKSGGRGWSWPHGVAGASDPRHGENGNGQASENGNGKASAAGAENPGARGQTTDDAAFEYLARLSHDLRSPANTLLGYIGNLEDGVRGELTPEQLKDLASMRRVASRLVSLVEQLQQYATIQRGGLRLAPADVPLAQAVAELQEAAWPQLQSREITLDRSTCRTGACQGVVRADPVALMRILTNLLDNAIKFTPVGGRITVSCLADAQAGTATVRVCDTGPGIPASETENIFEPFVQLDTPGRGAHGGVGLGLANSRDLARAMDGELRAESTPGAGAVFVLTLPLA
jgi:signal transduction histidine kinase